MKTDLHSRLAKEQLALLVLIVLALFLTGFAAYEYFHLRDELKSLALENESLVIQLNKLNDTQTDLLKENRHQREVIISLGGQIEYFTTTVSTLEKLTQTDPELLKKYSKVYFLSENYVPTELTPIDSIFVAEVNGGNLLFLRKAWPFLEKLIVAARSNNIELQVASAYRSFGTQSSLKAEYKVIYGATTANQFSADQGYSEHQMGTTVDFTTPQVGEVSLAFKDDPAYEWLLKNAYQFGFVLSYPDGNAYYKFEPWHWRFVGVELASEIYSSGKYFYDLDQREIDSYLVKLFD